MTDWLSTTTYTIRSGAVSLALERFPSSNTPAGAGNQPAATTTPPREGMATASANGKDSPFFSPNFHGENMGEHCYYWPLVLT